MKSYPGLATTTRESALVVVGRRVLSETMMLSPTFRNLISPLLKLNPRPNSMRRNRRVLVAALATLDERLLQLYARDAGFARRPQEVTSSWASVICGMGVSSWASAAGPDDVGGDGAGVRERLLSRLLTYPMTVARFSNHLCPQASSADPVSLLVLGARAEAQLPALYWETLALVTGRRWHITFVGPHLADKQLPMVHSVLRAHDRHVTFDSQPGLFHDVVARGDMALGGADGVVLFNSGIGHPKEGLKWRDSLQLLCKEECRANLLLTSFNDADLANDEAALLDGPLRDFSRKSATNPMRSLWPDEHQGDSVVTNHAATLLAVPEP